MIFRMAWLDLLAVQGTLKSLLQCYSSKASILQCSAFFIIQLSHPYMTSGKTIAASWPYINTIHSKESNRLGKLLLTPLTERRLHLIICKELLQIKSKQKLPSIKRGDEHCLELCWSPAGVATPASASQGPRPAQVTTSTWTCAWGRAQPQSPGIWAHRGQSPIDRTGEGQVMSPVPSAGRGRRRGQGTSRKELPQPQKRDAAKTGPLSCLLSPW